ncbi:molybdate ABC transporter substrate-binding protein [Marimonas sp. MJW-29]|uniref:Molybdate ABC transporter substrate-binding protein n=1 Tax=Sulfitobacter sediminis TaxID=3234186 RepID=A0ABV3RL52_9RHOB
MKFFAAFLFCLFAALPTLAAAQDRVTVFAAASLRGALEEIAADFTGDVSLSFGGSGTMARQIAAGAPADVVVLASTLWMDWLVAEGTAISAGPEAVASNALVVIGAADAAPLESPDALAERLGTDRLAMGHRTAVPAGTYARQWLEFAGLWETLEDRLAETDNVRAALAFVARGAAPFGIVYASDAAAEPAVQVLWRVDPAAHDPILYPAAALTPAGVAFFDALLTPDAEKTFAVHGFAPVDR